MHGRNIHNIRAAERDRLAIHYHQSYQVRHLRNSRPAFMMEHAKSDYPVVHLFDEPQFNTQDGYIGFMLDFFRKLRREGRLVFLCVHPNERFHQNGRLTQIASFDELIDFDPACAYLGDLLKEDAA